MKKNITLKNNVSEKINDSIFITGSARSGTTIMGKLIHSMKYVEYTFEPPTVLTLLSVIEEFRNNSNLWKIIFETYLYEDFFVNSIAGRNLNFKTNEDSFIYLVKNRNQIEERLNNNSRKHLLNLDKYKIAFKIPDIAPYLKNFKNIYPNVWVIFMVRNASDTINSLLRKGWFNSESLKNNNRIWPLIKFNGSYIPHWVSNDMREEWCKMNEVDRCAYYYIQNQTIIEESKIIYINYDFFVDNTSTCMHEIINYLKIDFGSKTKKIIDKVSKRETKRDQEILKKIRPTLRKKIKYIESNMPTDIFINE
ncbi:sulfotransferase [Gracilimonas amylolytica]|uniref:sulfotransferase n=1 Tax=Gracilimonas amylolytica TaxID=1749045 RepID=UPI000CD89120|nr:sulfotransferase [Gracilimonas amylolytica]